MLGNCSPNELERTCCHGVLFSYVPVTRKEAAAVVALVPGGAGITLAGNTSAHAESGSRIRVPAYEALRP
jgi:hypothetical protein